MSEIDLPIRKDARTKCHIATKRCTKLPGTFSLTDSTRARSLDITFARQMIPKICAVPKCKDRGVLTEENKVWKLMFGFLFCVVPGRMEFTKNQKSKHPNELFGSPMGWLELD